MKQENYIKGMIMIILSAFFFACMNVSVRLAGDLPPALCVRDTGDSV